LTGTGVEDVLALAAGLAEAPAAPVDPPAEAVGVLALDPHPAITETISDNTANNPTPRLLFLCNIGFFSLRKFKMVSCTQRRQIEA
jgi:hypothetical protein